MKRHLFPLCLAVLLVQAIEGQLVYRVDFENGTVNASPGTAHIESTTTGPVRGRIEAVDNPSTDSLNPSPKAGLCQAPPGYVRAELSSQRLPTHEKSYIYKWSYYLPSDFYADATVNWLLLSQFKTWPCGRNLFPDQICGNGGIFNELEVTDDRELWFRFRAEPDCKGDSIGLAMGRWISFVLEIKWTKTDSGYAILYADNKKVFEARDFKTLYDSLRTDGSCNIYWAVGLYADWSGTKAALPVYIDDIEIWDKADGSTLCSVCPECCASTGLGRDRKTPARLEVAFGASSIRFDLPASSQVNLSLYNVSGHRVCTILDGVYSTGEHVCNLKRKNVRAMASGVYLMKLTAGKERCVKKVLLTR